MRRRGLLLVLFLLCIPQISAALQLHWVSGERAISFSEARRCTLVVAADSMEEVLPPEWRLLWVAEDYPDLVIVPDSEFVDAEMAQAVSVLRPTTAELDANQVTANFRLPNAAAVSAARWIVDLPAGSAGKFIAYAIADNASGSTGALVRSQTVTFNGGVLDDFPPLVLGATGDHTTTRLSVKAVGAGLGNAASASLVAADTSWRVPLEITESTDSTLTAEADVPTQLPDGFLQVSPASSMSAATPVPSALVAAPLSTPVTIMGNSFLVPVDSAGVSPKDFAFVYNTVPTAVPGVWRGLFHLIYIRHLANGTEVSLGHAWSTDLQNWTSDRYAFRAGPIGTWDAQHVWAPSVVQNGNLYYMFYTGTDQAGNQRAGRVWTTLLDTTNTVWSQSDRKMVFSADSTSWVVRHPQATFNGADQFRDPFVFPDPDTAFAGRFLMVYSAMDTNYKARSALSVGLARNRAGTLDRWIDLGRYGATDWGRNGHLTQIESPHVFPDSGSAPLSGWRLMYTWGGNNPDSLTLRVLRDTLTTNVADTSRAGWGANQAVYKYLASDHTVVGWNGSEHLRAGNVEYLAGYNAYLVDGIQIARMYWNAGQFSLKVPAVTGVDVVNAVTATVRLSVLNFDPRSQRVVFRINLPVALPVRFDVYDVMGRRLQTLVNRRLPMGGTTVQWDHSGAGGASVASGVYFARLTYESGSRVAQVPVIR